MDGTDTQRLPQKDKRNQAPVSGILEQAESVAGRVLESIQATAGTTACKGVQIARLADWEKNVVYKLNDFRYSDDNLTPFFERIKAQNEYFPDYAYTLIGFAENKSGKVCAVIQQPYIISSREATDEEIKTELERLGFESQMDGEYYTNGLHDIFDALPNNVLVGIDGNLYFIDTIIYKSDEGNVATYHSQSPYHKENSY